MLTLFGKVKRRKKKHITHIDLKNDDIVHYLSTLPLKIRKGILKFLNYADNLTTATK